MRADNDHDDCTERDTGTERNRTEFRSSGAAAIVAEMPFKFFLIHSVFSPDQENADAVTVTREGQDLILLSNSSVLTTSGGGSFDPISKKADGSGMLGDGEMVVYSKFLDTPDPNDALLEGVTLVTANSKFMEPVHNETSKTDEGSRFFVPASAGLALPADSN